MSLVPVRDGGGKIIGSVSVARDVIDKRLREKLLDAHPSMTERQIRQLVALIDRLLDTFQEGQRTDPPDAG